jgi:hypothetical protein
MKTLMEFWSKLSEDRSPRRKKQQYISDKDDEVSRRFYKSSISFRSFVNTVVFLSFSSSF